MGLEDYVRVYKNHFTQDYCKTVVDKIAFEEWSPHYFYSHGTNSKYTHNEDLSILLKDTDYARDLTKSLWNVIRKYYDDNNDCVRWFDGWNGYTHARFNKYDVNTRMQIHCDHISSLFDGTRKGVPILTILGALNDDYTGGELMLWTDKVIELKAGDVMVFPSNFLYPHEVKKVLSGVRYSYVSWVW